ncbi:hypothetical protein [Kineococcus sp. NPDC059986]|uniref:DUF6924 domain-containing protein n=1 Tax=Kineococcus sp. NPDC059986 TaxID=3155538 RepID=UPI00344B8F49
MRRLVPLTVLLLALSACGADHPAGTSASDPTPVTATPSATGELPPGCEPPPDAAEGDSWICVRTGDGGPDAEAANRERLAAQARESPGWSDEDAQRADEERLRQVAEQDDALVASGALPADRGPLLVRTDFSDQGRWDALLTTVDTPTAEGFRPSLSTIEQQRWNGASVSDVAAAAPPHVLVVVADATTFATPALPLLVAEREDDGVQEQRVVARALASVVDDLSTHTKDWEEFAAGADADGVFRGSP